MKIKFKKLHPDAQLPTKSDGNIGWDLYYVGDDVSFYPGQRVKLDTGLSWEPEPGYHGFLWDRSGLSVKEGQHRLAGVIDWSYRGPIVVCLVNLDFQLTFEFMNTPEYYGDTIIPSNQAASLCTGNKYTVKHGDKIAQLIIQQEVPTEVEWAEELSETDRGENGFGSSGR